MKNEWNPRWQHGSLLLKGNSWVAPYRKLFPSCFMSLSPPVLTWGAITQNILTALMASHKNGLMILGFHGPLYNNRKNLDIYNNFTSCTKYFKYLKVHIACNSENWHTPAAAVQNLIDTKWKNPSNARISEGVKKPEYFWPFPTVSNFYELLHFKCVNCSGLLNKPTKEQYVDV